LERGSGSSKTCDRDVESGILFAETFRSFVPFQNSPQQYSLVYLFGRYERINIILFSHLKDVRCMTEKLNPALN